MAIEIFYNRTYHQILRDGHIIDIATPGRVLTGKVLKEEKGSFPEESRITIELEPDPSRRGSNTPSFDCFTRDLESIIFTHEGVSRATMAQCEITLYPNQTNGFSILLPARLNPSVDTSPLVT